MLLIREACKDGKYGAGMSGKIIKLAYATPYPALSPASPLETGGADPSPRLTLYRFDRLYSGKIEDGGRRCGGCGSSYMANDCHVTMNFCEKCKSVNTDVAPAA